MFRKVLPLLAIPLLAACGSDEDFSVNVGASSKKVAHSLNQLNPNALTSAAGVRPVKITRMNGEDFRALQYVLRNPGGETGEVLFHMTETAADRTVIDVTVDLPFVTRETAGGTEFLSETEIEKALRSAMRDWKKDVESGSSANASGREVAEVVSLAAIGLQDLDQFEELATSALYERHMGDIARAEWSAPTADWGDDDSENNETATTFAYEDEVEAEDGGWGDGS
uniref:hypothetical protein n=1 Tax=uncultured Erythrobacter sp. TaxID=263913 RepID=UPI0026036A19|nr:hypothetical protein [uncultured Erythrobacter sp.]